MADDDFPLEGTLLAPLGQASVVRIPIPGLNGLAIEFSPRGFVPKGGSTSTLFLQTASGNPHLRLDFGYNVKSKGIDYHWNQKGTFDMFKIADHTTVGRAGRVAYQAARYFRYAGRAFVLLGAAVDAYSIVVASKPIRRASEVVVGWAAAWLGCQRLGAKGAQIGLASKNPIGVAAGGVAGCIIGGAAGYVAGGLFAGAVYDWAEDTVFQRLDETSAP